jgi:peptidoglycan/xylan/chitin deacetylase (PgdA/CDA1 family)
VKPATCFTTSWDDGHPLDLRIAELLARYGLTGTFYLPMESGRETMAPTAIRQISSLFEVGAHTLHHVNLSAVSDTRAREEIMESKAWIEYVTGKRCAMFCFPKGHFRRSHLRFVKEAGYAGARTVELLSVDFPQPKAGISLMPTTIQAFPHTGLAYARNLAKRFAFGNLRSYVLHGRSTDWLRLVESFQMLSLRKGGVFHLWGHSWEIEKQAQWRRLEEALRFMSQFTQEAPCLTNIEVCRHAVSC